jgi:ABC-type branched-subunit amino acid transport system substrate-binding protein
VALFVAGCAARPPAPTPPPAPRPAEPPRTEAPAAPIRIGAILPLTGDASLQQYGTLIREGIDIALRESGSRIGSRAIELIVLDDAGDAERARVLVDSLVRRGAIAAVGPLLGDALQAAAGSRPDSTMALISPTASEVPSGRVNAYTLNAGDTRGAEALAEYAARGGLTPVGILRAESPESTAEARAFAAALQGTGQRAAIEVTYSPGLATFSQQLERLKAANVRSIYIPAAARDIRQLAPQLAYYGLQNVQILGSEAWVDEDVLRNVDAKHLEGALVSVPLFRGSADVAWESFVGRYEAAHRRTLDNPYPALGYDAMRLILTAAMQGRPERSEVARRLAGVSDHRGATGVLSLRGGVVTRRPFLIQIRNGRPALLSTVQR